MAKVEDDLIILDAQADVYACLFARADQVALAGDGVIAAPADLEAALLEAGFIQTTAPAGLRKSPTPPARSTSAPSSSLTAVLVGVAECGCDALVFRSRALHQLVQPPRLHPRPAADAAVIAADFAAALPWAPANGACLQRAFQLRRRLARRGVAVDWVFGVRTWPFSAHCWLQIDDRVIGDRLERVSAYTPIAAF
ncbi:MAG: lasso peptide biosynthesis B2 protein [Brevundimonas sp.]